MSQKQAIHLTEEELQSLTKLIQLTPTLVTMVEMLEKMEGAFVLFIKLGNGIKWLSGIITALVALYYLVFYKDASLLKAIFRNE